MGPEGRGSQRALSREASAGLPSRAGSAGGGDERLFESALAERTLVSAPIAEPLRFFHGAMMSTAPTKPGHESRRAIRRDGVTSLNNHDPAR